MASLWVTAQRAGVSLWVMGAVGVWRSSPPALTQAAVVLCLPLERRLVQCLVTATAADRNTWSGLEFKYFGKPSEAKMWRTFYPNGSPKQLAALQG